MVFVDVSAGFSYAASRLREILVVSYDPWGQGPRLLCRFAAGEEMPSRHNY